GARKHNAQHHCTHNQIPSGVLGVLRLGFQQHTRALRYLRLWINSIRIFRIVSLTAAYAAAARPLRPTADVAVLTWSKSGTATLTDACAVGRAHAAAFAWSIRRRRRFRSRVAVAGHWQVFPQRR